MYTSSILSCLALDIDVGFGLTPPDPKKRFKGYAVSKIVPHPESMSSTGYNDLALLVLNDTIPSSVASTTKIYSGDYYIDTPISVAGFGLTDPKNNQSVPTQLMEASLAVGKDSFCKKSSRNFSHKTQLCTDGTGDADACFGDGGGPLVTPVDSGSEFALLAITSYFGLTTTNSKGDCAVPGAPTFYTRVGAYIDWIAGVAGVDAESISVTNKTQHPAVSDDASDSEVSASASRSYTGLSRTSTGLSRPTGTLATASPLTKSADASRLLSHSCIALLLALASIFAAL
ncbi:hypothetical protein GGI12_003873 [Dipsacomyces acuminosporus]|nr:hypothetical protein GGI12_003873 [Dipsacomyces acuminosporus]